VYPKSKGHIDVRNASNEEEEEEEEEKYTQIT
jgi:hypothetical protein